MLQVEATPVFDRGRLSGVIKVRSFICPSAGKPFDGHTLGAALGQIKRLVVKYPGRVYLDKGYCGCSPVDPAQTKT